MSKVSISVIIIADERIFAVNQSKRPIMSQWRLDARTSYDLGVY